MSFSARRFLPSLVLAPVFLAGAVTSAQVDRNLYPENTDAAAQIRAAIQQATRVHKHILLDFGGNWCSDCQVLNIALHQPANAQLLAESYIVVHVNIGHMDENLATATRYHVPVTKGVPALAVLDEHGRLLYAEQEKEFEHPTAESIGALLDRWKP